MTLRLLGRAGLGALVDRTMAVAAHLERRVAADPVFETSGAAADRARLDRVQTRLQQEVERRGYAWFPTVRMAGAVWLRFGVFNYRTTPTDVDRTLVHVKRVAKDLGFG